MKKFELKSWTYFFAAILILLVFSCGTKTKNKTELSNEKAIKEEVKITDSIKKMETFIVTEQSQREKQLTEQFKQENQEDDVELTITETVEVESKEPIYIETESGRFINIANGRITNTKTTTTSKKKKNETVTKNLEIIEETAEKIEAANTEIISKQATIEIAKEYIESNKSSNTTVKKEPVSIWFWVKFSFWFLLLVFVLAYLFRKWLGIQFPFLQFFKIFRTNDKSN